MFSSSVAVVAAVILEVKTMPGVEVVRVDMLRNASTSLLPPTPSSSVPVALL